MNRNILTALVTLIAAITAAVAITAPPANAAVGSMAVNLGLGRYDCSSPYALYWGCQQELWITGMVRTSSYAEALQVHNSYRFEFRLWGDDPSSDDFLSGPTHFTSEPRLDGVYFEKRFWVPTSKLNEDQSWYDNHDEVYAGIRMVNWASGSTIRSAETNRVYGYF